MFSVIQKIAESRPSCLSTSFLLLVGLGCGLGGEVAAQATGAAGEVLEVEPRFERLFGTDSLRLVAGWGGPNDMRSPVLSPDGRWILFGALGQGDRTNLWLSPLDGGEMVLLTEGQYMDDGAQWFASGEAIAFSSTRPAGDERFRGGYVMRMPISPESGRPLGPPRQVSLEPTTEHAISPDDQWIAYVTHSSEISTDRTMSLRVVPATGGTARTVITLPGYIMAIRWGTEGRFFYLLTWPDFEVKESVLVRVPVEGGTPERIASWNTIVRLSPHARYFHREIPSVGEGEGRRWEAGTVDGQHRVTFDLPEPLDLMGFGGRPGQLLAARVDLANPLRVIPVAGGPVRRLNEAWDYDLPMDWSPDGQEVFFKTQLNGQPIYMLAPLDGSPMRQVPLPGSPVEGWPILSGDGEHVLFFTDPQEGPREAWIYDIRGDSARKLDEGPQPPGYSYWYRWGITGRGGTFMRDEAVFLYGITRNGRHELLAADPEGAPSLLWSFPDEGHPPFVAVYGARVAYAQAEGEEASLYLARAGEDRARLLLTRPGLLNPRGHGLSMWSPDGRRLAVRYIPPPPAKGGVLVVEVSDAGEVVGEPLMLEGGEIGQWMPDSQHFLGGGNWGGNDPWGAGVSLVSLDPDVPPVRVSADVHESIWYFRLSPDGRYITFESEIPRGSSVWQVDLDLGEAFRAAVGGGG